MAKRLNFVYIYVSLDIICLYQKDSCCFLIMLWKSLRSEAQSGSTLLLLTNLSPLSGLFSAWRCACLYNIIYNKVKLSMIKKISSLIPGFQQLLWLTGLQTMCFNPFLILAFDNFEVILKFYQCYDLISKSVSWKWVNNPDSWIHFQYEMLWNYALSPWYTKFIFIFSQLTQFAP